MNPLFAPLSEAAVERLGWILIHSLWQFTLVALVAVVVMRLMRRRNASIRYVVLMFVMSAAVILSIVTWTMQPTASNVERAEMIAPTVVEEIPLAAESIMPHDPIIPSTQPIPVAIDEPPAMRNESFPAPRDVKPYELTWTERIHHYFEPYLEWIVAGWTLGVIICSFRPLFGWYTLLRLKRIGTSPVTEHILVVVNHLSQQLGLNWTVRVMQSTLARLPVVVGYFRPVILLTITST